MASPGSLLGSPGLSRCSSGALLAQFAVRRSRRAPLAATVGDPAAVRPPPIAAPGQFITLFIYIYIDMTTDSNIFAHIVLHIYVKGYVSDCRVEKYQSTPR